jgi:hypothetical protein
MGRKSTPDRGKGRTVSQAQGLAAGDKNSDKEIIT